MMTMQEEMDNLREQLDTLTPGPEWDKAYNRYCELRAIEQEEYKRQNIGMLRTFYDDHIAGKTYAEIPDEDWEWYSDFHKDVFGYRPRSLNFGEYVPVRSEGMQS